MTSSQPVGPYRTAAPREQALRPLPPEEEMRLLLTAAELPRRRRAWVLAAFALVGAAAMVVAGHPDALAALLYFLLPVIGSLATWVGYRRRLSRLRSAGYDVDGVTAQLRVLDQPRVRIDARLDDRSAETDVEDVAPDPDAAGPRLTASRR